MRRKFLGYLMVFGVVMSFLVLQPLVNATGSPIPTLIVKMTSDDASVETAVGTLRAHLPGALVVQHGSSASLLARLHPVQQVIFVGHGGVEGVTTPDGRVSWAEYAKVVSLYSAVAYYLLNCHSTKAVSKLPGVINDRVLLAFGMDVDARVAALLASLTVLAVRGQSSKAFAVFEELAIVANALYGGILDVLPLGYVPYMYRMGWNELGYWIIELVILVLPMIIGPLLKVIAKKLAKIGGKFWAKISAKLSRSSSEAGRLSKIIKALKGFWTNWGEFITLGKEILGFFFDYFDYLWAAIAGSLTWWEALIWGASLLATITGLFVTGGWSTVLTIAASAWDIYKLVGGIYIDWNDYGDYPYARYGNH